ncbi:LysR family transcriptional regulator OS=Streptomyces tendae OX=1932 GN=GUR47_23560 PE=3 SV=1 [Streptomyces tendae]
MQDRAVAAIRRGSRALRIDVLGLRSAQAVILHDYWRSHPETTLDVVTLKVDDPRLAVAAVQAGDVDASFRSVTDPADLPRELRMIHAFHSPLELVVGPGHPLASARTVTPAQLRGHRIWVPGIAPGSGIGRSSTRNSPRRSTCAWTPRARTSATRCSSTSWPTPTTWPPSWARATGTSGRPATTCAASRSRRPTLAYPLSLILPRENPLPGLRAVVNHFAGLAPLPDTWLPSWATAPHRDDGDGDGGRDSR